MSVPKDVRCLGSESYDSFPAASVIPVGAAVVVSTASQGADTIKAAEAETSILGLADKREFLLKGGYDDFYAQYESVPIVSKRGYAWVTPNGAAVNIDQGDFLQVAVLGDGTPGNHGVLEEAAAGTGTVFTIACVAKALESVTMGSSAYKVPASNVSVGDTSITMTSGDPTTMDLSVGDHILLEDLNGACQHNKVASVSATSIGLVMPSTVALTTGNSDLVTKLFQCKVELIK